MRTTQAPSTPALSIPAKAWRVALVLTLSGLFLGGTTVGNDHWWPFSPWRMYSTSTPVTGSVGSTFMEVRTEGSEIWEPASLSLSSVGLNRAEVEGRFPQITRDPQLLATLAETHARLRPGEPTWVGVRVVVRRFAIVDARITGDYTDDVVAEWARG